MSATTASPTVASNDEWTRQALLSGWTRTPSSGSGPTMNRQRSHHGAVVLGGETNKDAVLLVAGGYETIQPHAPVLRSVEIWESPTTNPGSTDNNKKNAACKWNKRAVQKLNQHRAEHATVLVPKSQRVYVIGGRGVEGKPLKTMECLDWPDEDEWIPLEVQLPVGLVGCTAVAVGSLVCIAGGMDESGATHTTVHVLDTAHGQWRRDLPTDLQTPRYGAGSALVSTATSTENTSNESGRIMYVVGGKNEHGQILRSIEFCRVTSQSSNSPTVSKNKLGPWQTSKMALSTPRFFPSVTAVSDGIFLVMGGEEHPNAAHSVVDVVDTHRQVVWSFPIATAIPGASAAVTLRPDSYGDVGIAVTGGLVPHASKNKMVVSGVVTTWHIEMASRNNHLTVLKEEVHRLKLQKPKVGIFGKLLGGSKDDDRANYTNLKSRVKQLQEQKDETLSTSDSNDAYTDEISQQFKGAMPSYDNGRIVAKSLLKRSGQAAVYRGIMIKEQRHGPVSDEPKKKGSKPASPEQTTVAMKVFNSRQDWQDCKNELMTLLRIPAHPNVMPVYDFFEVPMPAFIMRYIAGGDLRDFLDRQGKFSEKRATPLLRGMAAGLDHLHSHDIVHRDLKSHNVMLERNKEKGFTPVLIDLGLGTTTQNRKPLGTRLMFETRCVQGTAGWMAPEMGSNRLWNTKTDMYALGVIMWEVLTGATPYPDRSFEDIIRFVVYDNGRPDDANGTRMKKAKVSEKNQALIRRLWDMDPNKRPSAKQFLALMPEA